MEVIFFTSDTGGVMVCTTSNGKIDFNALGDLFGLEPRSITLCGIGFPRCDLESEATWTEIKNVLGVGGTREDPVVVSGRLKVPTEPPITLNTVKKLLEETTKKLFEDGMTKLEDGMTKLVRESTAKSAESVSMSSISTKLADSVLEVVGFSVVDGSVVEPAMDVSVPKEWEFDMGLYAREEDCYEPFFQHMVKYLNTVHSVKIQKDPPFSREAGCCRLLDVHKVSSQLELETEVNNRKLKISGNLDAVFVPPKRGIMQFKDSLLGGVEVKHLPVHKEKWKYGAPTVGTSKSGRSTVPGQAMMEALAVYGYSNFPEGIFLLTSYNDNVVMELKDMEIRCWAELNFAQAMAKIAAFLKGEGVQRFLKESEKPARSREGPHISESKRAVRRRLNIDGLGNEVFLQQVDAIRSAAESPLELVSDLFQLMESWRYSTTEASGSAGPLSYFS